VLASVALGRQPIGSFGRFDFPPPDRRSLSEMRCSYATTSIGGAAMMTVPEAARRARRNPETIRRWIREGRLRATKIGTQHVLDEKDLDQLLGRFADTVDLPAAHRVPCRGTT